MPRILVADDEPRLLHIVSLYLSMEGHEVTSATDGFEALRALQGGGYDVAILDVMMPGLDGIEVLRALRANPATHDIPVFLFTSLSSTADVERARLAGANHMITKPFSLPGLSAVIRNAFEKAALAS